MLQKWKRRSEGKYVEKEVEERLEKKKTSSKLESGDIKRSVRSCVDSVDHHISKKKREEKPINHYLGVYG